MKTSINNLFFFMILGIMTAGAFSCQDEEENTSPVQGEWNWTRTSGGLLGVEYTPSSTNTSISYKFNSDFSFEEQVNGVLGRTGNFTVISNSSTSNLNLEFNEPFQPDFYDAYALYEGGFTMEIDNNILTLDGGIAADGVLYEFERIE